MHMITKKKQERQVRSHLGAVADVRCVIAARHQLESEALALVVDAVHPGAIVYRFSRIDDARLDRLISNATIAIVDMSLVRYADLARVRRWRLECMLVGFNPGRGVIESDLAEAFPHKVSIGDPLEMIRATVARAAGGADREVVPPHAAQPEDVGLTPRQSQVLGALLRGDPTARIAEDLGVTDATVRSTMFAIGRRLGAQGRVQMVLKAQAMGWSADMLESAR
jgi:DNA-binding CsgD family transcriptional regulator